MTFNLSRGRLLTSVLLIKCYSSCELFVFFSLLQALHTAASSMPLTRGGHCTWAQRTPFLKPMMADLKTSSRISLKSECLLSLCLIDVSGIYAQRYTCKSFCQITLLLNVIDKIEHKNIKSKVFFFF